ncbi:MAG: Crp/Fnr family transcriptional regulator [Oliverpabstia sp.]
MNCIFLSKTVLFRGIQASEIEEMMSCLGARETKYKKGEFIYRTGDLVESMGLVLSGNVHIESDDIWGNKSLLDSVGPGQFFAETYACLPGEPMMVNVFARQDSEILFINIRKLMEVCHNTCAHHSKLIQNLLTLSAQKNLNLSRRIFHTSSKTIRGRLLSYLSSEALRQGKYEFTIPYNRQQLADYLGVDRSALSNELSKMQKDGILVTDKNNFKLM